MLVYYSLVYACPHAHPPPLPSSENVVKCLCALVVTAERSVDELFMHYFHSLSSASADFTPRLPPGLYP